jgi:hypothetical protein
MILSPGPSGWPSDVVNSPLRIEPTGVALRIVVTMPEAVGYPVQDQPPTHSFDGLVPMSRPAVLSQQQG